jgi:hypothetical protein
VKEVDSRIETDQTVTADIRHLLHTAHDANAVSALDATIAPQETTKAHHHADLAWCERLALYGRSRSRVLLATNWMPSCRPSFAAASRACRMDSASGSRPTTSHFGNALAIATATRPTPQPTSRTRPPFCNRWTTSGSFASQYTRAPVQLTSCSRSAVPAARSPNQPDVEIGQGVLPLPSPCRSLPHGPKSRRRRPLPIP